MRNVVGYPYSRVPLDNRARPVKNLGMGELPKPLDSSGKGRRGHWCSHCEGIRYGRGFEVACPVCGSNRVMHWELAP